MCWRSSRVAAVWMAFLLAGPAFADEAQISYVNFDYTNQPLSDEFVDYVARFGARTPFEAIPGADISAYVDALCGETSERNVSLFKKSLGLQGIETSGAGELKLAPGTLVLHLPPCLPVPKLEKVPAFAERGARIWDYYKQAGRAGALSFGVDGQARPTPVDDAIRAEVIASVPADVPIFSKFGIDSAAVCAQSASRDCGGAPLPGQGNYDVLVTQALKTAAELAGNTDRLAADAFLIGNDLIRIGVNPAITKQAVQAGLKEAFSTNGQANDVRSTKVAATIGSALDKYSEPNGGLASSQWEALWDSQRTAAQTTASYQQQLAWFVPNNATRPNAMLDIGDMILPPQTVKQAVQIPIDLAAVSAAGQPARPPDIAAADGNGGFIEARVDSRDSWPIFSAAASQCTSQEHYNWGGRSFYGAFLRALAQSRVRAYLDGKTQSTALIKILDTGYVQVNDMGVFSDDMFDEKGPQRMRQSAHKLIGDDYAHGTAVAGVALGGPELFSLLPALGASVKIEHRRVYAAPEGGQKAFLDYKLLNAAISERGDVFNLSFTSTNNAMIKDRFSDYARNKLIVVAAGNNNLNNAPTGASLNANDLYPQSWGGDADWPNLLTVGSLDGRKRADFSNWSERQVLIAAPGCAVRSWAPLSDQSRFQEASFNGTSFSAPIVSYVAAVVMALAPKTKSGANNVAMRIIASSDLLPELKGVVDGRALNPIKAVSVYEDVVELAGNGENRLLVGGLNERDIGAFCAGSYQFPANSNLLKIARIPRASNESSFLYYFERNGRFYSDTCSKNTSALLFTVSETGEQITINTSDVVDFVPRMP